MDKDKILIIEDDKDIAELIRDYFEMNEFEPTIIGDGAEGLKTALSGNFDIILLDIMLPGMDGFEILKAIRAEKSLPVLFVSAKDSDIDVIRGLGLGADDYVKKPFIPSELVARATANLKRYRSLTASAAQDKKQSVNIGALSIDFDARRVTRDGSEISLTNKEFDLLSFFINNPNKVFSREALFANVWDSGSYGDVTTVTVHMKRLREKIEEEPNNPALIETVWGAGYRMNNKADVE